MAIVVFSLGSTIFPTSGSQLGLQHWTRILLYEVELKLENWWLYAGKSAVIAPSLLSLCDNNCCLWNWQLSRPTDYLSPAAAYTLDIGRTDSRQWGFQVSFGLTLPSPFFKLCGIFSNGVLPSNFFFLKKCFSELTLEPIALYMLHWYSTSELYPIPWFPESLAT